MKIILDEDDFGNLPGEVTKAILEYVTHNLAHPEKGTISASREQTPTVKISKLLTARRKEKLTAGRKEKCELCDKAAEVHRDIGPPMSVDPNSPLNISLCQQHAIWMRSGKLGIWEMSIEATIALIDSFSESSITTLKEICKRISDDPDRPRFKTGDVFSDRKECNGFVSGTTRAIRSLSRNSQDSLVASKTRLLRASLPPYIVFSPKIAKTILYVLEKDLVSIYKRGPHDRSLFNPHAVEAYKTGMGGLRFIDYLKTDDDMSKTGFGTSPDALLYLEGCDELYLAKNNEILINNHAPQKKPNIEKEKK